MATMNARPPVRFEKKNKNQSYLFGVGATMLMLSVLVAQRGSQCHGFRVRLRVRASGSNWRQVCSYVPAAVQTLGTSPTPTTRASHANANRNRNRNANPNPMAFALPMSIGELRTSTSARYFSRCGFESTCANGRCASRTAQSLWRSRPSFCDSLRRPTTTTTRKALYSTTTQTSADETTTSTEITDRTLYQQFKDLSIEIRMHDELYYTGGTSGDVSATATDNNNSNSNNNNNNNNDDADGGKRPAVAAISDDDFDALVRREEELETKHPEFLRAWRIESGLGEAATRSGRVGTDMMMMMMMTTMIPGTNSNIDGSDGGGGDGEDASNKNVRLKRRLLSPMLSLDNVLNDEQLHGWLKRVVKATNEWELETEADSDADADTEETQRPTLSSRSTISIVTEPKLDGVSLSLRYESGGAETWSTSDDDGSEQDPMVVLELQWASTRGDGKVGQDVTAAANQMPGIPSRIGLPSSCFSGSEGNLLAVEVRGEVVLPRSEFLRMRRAEAEGAAAASAAREALEQATQQANATSAETETKTKTENVKNTTGSDGGATDEDSPKPNKQKIISFSNPRNAASGILLRKESDDPEEDSQSRELRSLLRFYAYDVSGLEKMQAQSGDESPEIDGIRIRQQLEDWGFPLALPVAITDIHWDRKDIIKTIEETIEETTGEEESEEESESAVSLDDWFRETIADKQIQPIMDYFSALEQHRENLQREDDDLLSANVSSSSKKPKPKSKETQRKKPSPTEVHYEWGDFDVDGCVHKVSQASIKSAMGYSMKSPKWATAHKFPAQSSVSRLLDIVVQVGRTGALTPVAILEPTEIGGVTVQRATLHNFGHLQEILGRGPDVGEDNGVDGEKTVVARIPKYDPVLLQRAGDVIPQVVRRIQSHAKSSSTASVDEDYSSEWISLEPPEQCPFCSSPVSYDTSESSASSVGQVIRCSGPPLLCPPRAVTSLKHAFSRDALDLTGLSEARIQQLMDAELLRYPSDIFRMGDTEWEKIAALPGWGEKSCKNLRDTTGTIASNGLALSRFIYSLGIRHVGKHTSELVADSYGSIGAFLEALEVAASYQEPPGHSNGEGGNSENENKDENENQKEDNDSLQEQKWQPFPPLERKLGIGPVMIESLLAFARSDELTRATKDLASSLTILEQDVVVDSPLGTDSDSGDPSADSAIGSNSNNNNSNSHRPWKGFRVVFTGSLGEGLTRSKAQDVAKQLGAKATPGSVSKSTDLVVYGDKGGKKLTQAMELGIPTIEANEFVRLAKEKGYL